MIPRTITSGDKVWWFDEYLSGINPDTGGTISYSPTTHTLKHFLRGASQLDVIATDNGDGRWLSTISAVESSALVVGDYWVQVAVEDANGDRTTLDTVQVKVTPNLATVATEYDGRSNAQKQLDLVESAITDIVTNGVSSYSIKGRSATYQDLNNLRTLRDELRIRVSRERNPSRNVLLRWGVR